MRMWVRLCPGRMHGVVIVVDMELVLENESGLELLEFLEQNALTVANTWFSKRDFTCKPGGIHVLSCGIANILLLCVVGCCILYQIAMLFIRRSLTWMKKLVCLTYNLPLSLVKRQPRRRTTQ